MNKTPTTSIKEIFYAFDATPIRFFVETCDDHKEVCELDFLAAAGEIEYKRHTVRENGVNQICLTKSDIY